jgi:hypothetical protein
VENNLKIIDTHIRLEKCRNPACLAKCPTLLDTKKEKLRFLAFWLYIPLMFTSNDADKLIENL